MREMKDSGIEWIGEIPKEWNIVRLKSLFDFGKGLPITKENLVEKGVPVISYGQIHAKFNTGVCLDNRLFRYVPETYIETHPSSLVSIGDILVADTSEDLEGCGNSVYVDKEMILFAGYHTIILQAKKRTNNKYIAYLLLTDNWRSQLRRKASGVKLFSVSKKMLSECSIILPLQSEQQKIAAHLDSECAKIDDVITKTKATIEEYKKLKQSVITEAVTKGIRPNREMKDSGIEWIGEIPKEWDVKVAFQLFSQVKNKNEGLIEKNLLSLSYGKIKRKSIDTIGGLLPENFDGYNIIEKDDIVLRLTDLQNDHTSLRVGLSNERGIVTSAYLTLRNYSDNTPLYLYYFLHSYDIYKGFYGMGAGVRQGLNWDGVKLLKIVLPPVEEQIEITDYLEKQVNIFDTLIAKKEQIVTELESYKKSLIYEYVTGKREVCDMNEKEEIITIFDPQATRIMQEALAYKVIRHSGDNLKGRIHLMKIIYMLDSMLGLDLGINYLRYTRGPYNPIIESIEKNLSDKGIISINTAKKYSYTVIDDSFDIKYNELFAKHNSEIEKIIDYMKRMKSSRAEKIATLYAAWNDMIIDGVQNITDKMIIDDVMNNWTENKAKTDLSTWQHILNEMKDKKIIPRGYGKHTSRKSE